MVLFWATTVLLYTCMLSKFRATAGTAVNLIAAGASKAC